MYVPSHFALSDAATQAALEQAGFAQLVTWGSNGLVSTPLPLIYDAERNVLLGHVARNNPHWREIGAGESVAIFAGLDAYVSPSYYASKAEHGRVVPTWNYETLHVHGTLTVHDDPEWVRQMVTALTVRHESARIQPWQVSDAPTKYLDGQLKAIVGLELSVTRVEGKAKMSQNRSEEDQETTIAALSASPVPAERAVAETMRANR